MKIYEKIQHQNYSFFSIIFKSKEDGHILCFWVQNFPTWSSACYALWIRYTTCTEPDHKQEPNVPSISLLGVVGDNPLQVSFTLFFPLFVVLEVFVHGTTFHHLFFNIC